MVGNEINKKKNSFVNELSESAGLGRNHEDKENKRKTLSNQSHLLVGAEPTPPEKGKPAT
jgi:hypothetical protein